ncbi:hypothetical protein D3Y57_19405 [Sphingomonas paeninsulae]|uniref:Uncharacterized protein n=1 Tax=Sphingomonas paeninsulae TaxID=2319844 RepID=A0A494TPF7_SPHPE|nr:hypothetical protein D3Y57_19405 [Sphingomonas paeninsulae]
MAASVIFTVVFSVGIKNIGASGFFGEPGRLLLVGMLVIPAALIVQIFRFWRKMFRPGERCNRETLPIIDATMWPVVVAFPQSLRQVPARSASGNSLSAWISSELA